MSRRRPKEIAVALDGHVQIVMVIADDGTMWQLHNGRWTSVPDLPQPEVKAVKVKGDTDGSPT